MVRPHHDRTILVRQCDVSRAYQQWLVAEFIAQADPDADRTGGDAGDLAHCLVAIQRQRRVAWWGKPGNAVTGDGGGRRHVVGCGRMRPRSQPDLPHRFGGQYGPPNQHRHCE